MSGVREGPMKGSIGAVQKQSGKVVLSTTLKNLLPNKDTEYYQIGLHGDYVQEVK